MFDCIEFSRFLEAAAEVYDRSAPTVEQWIDDLYRRIGSNPETVALTEVLFAQRLRDDGQWMDPHYATNGLLHMLDRIGRSTAGMIDH